MWNKLFRVTILLGYNSSMKRYRKFIKSPGFYLKALRANPIRGTAVFLSQKWQMRFDMKYSEHPLKNFVSVSSLNKTIKHNLQTVSISDFLAESGLSRFQDYNREQKLKVLLDFWGSDKASVHNYHLIYQPLIDSFDKPILAEIGLGTNRLDTFSNMGMFGKPGASARAFRDFKINLSYMGGDIDSRILFSDNGINCRWVDQTKIESVATFLDSNMFSLVIDDGLHLPIANLNVLSCFLESESKWLIIEDINYDMSNFWLSIMDSAKLSKRSWLVETKSALVLIVNQQI